MSSGEQRPLAHALEPEPVLAPLAVEPAPVVGDAQQRAPDERQLDVRRARAGVLGDVREALLRDAVDRQLLLGAQAPGRAAVAKRRADARLLGEVAHLRVERGDQPVVVEHRRAQPARESQELLHRLRGEPLRVAQFRLERGGRRDDRRLEPQQDRRERLVDLVVEVLREPLALALLRADRRLPGRVALGLEPLAQPLELRPLALERRVLAAQQQPAERRSPHALPIGVRAILSEVPKADPV